MTKNVTSDTKAARNVKNRTKVAKQVRELLNKRPFLMNVLAQNIVNYSALARVIQKEIGRVSIDAIKTSLIREREAIKNQKVFSEEQVLKLLKNSRISLRDKIAVVISPDELKIPYIISSNLIMYHIYIVDQTRLKLKDRGNIKINKNLVALILESPEKLESLPGVVAFITQLLVSQGINIKEFISCYTDTIIVLTKEDGLKTFNLLQRYV